MKTACIKNDVRSRQSSSSGNDAILRLTFALHTAIVGTFIVRGRWIIADSIDNALDRLWTLEVIHGGRDALLDKGITRGGPA